MKIQFTKMSGAGNDFVFLGPEWVSLRDRAPELARALCARRTSVGADGLILVETAADGIRMHYFNSDGSEASFCGNGARCLVLYCTLKGIATGKVEFRSGAGVHAGEVTDRGVRVSMDAPRFIEDLVVEDRSRKYEVSLVEAGVPHAIIMTEQLAAEDVEGTGSFIRHLEDFAPDGANVDFVEPEDGRYMIRTYERGVERETLACGSGCVAAAHALKLKEKAGNVVDFRVASGDILTVELPEGESDWAHLIGPARVVFEGQAELKEL